MRWIAGLLILLPLLVGGHVPCPEPDYPRIEDCPFEVDPSLVVGRLLACVRVELGRELVHTRTWCDPDGDPARVEIVSGPEGVRIVNKPRIQSYTLFWKPREVTTAAIVVRVTDEPRTGRPKSDTGTILVQVVPRGYRPPPRGCGGPPQ
jgi:hypothetical protein